MAATILVTGGAGLVGNQLIQQLLNKGKAVLALYNKTPLTQFNNPLLQQVCCNILDVQGLLDCMKGIEQVYHCAAIVSFNPNKKAALFKVNIEGTTNIVNAALESGVQKLVHVSSVAALGRIREDGPVDETMNWTAETNNSIYGQSKHLAEMEVWRGIGEGLNAVIINPAIILGAGDWNAGSSKIFKTAYEEFAWYTDGVSGFVDVRDVATIMIELMQSNITEQRFIISAENKTFKEVFSNIAIAFNKKPPYKKVTPFIAQMVWRLAALKSWFSKQEPLLTKESANTAQAKVYFNNQKLLQYLPQFAYTPIDETIAYTCKKILLKNNL